MNIPQIKGVRVNGVMMRYAEAGDGKPLVCVHGNFASKRWFTEQLKEPPKGYRVIALDLPSFGESDPLPGEITIKAYAEYLTGFIETVGLKRPVVVGHSLGGSVVQTYAMNHPQAPAGLVFIDSAAPAGLNTPKESLMMLEMMRGKSEMLAQALTPAMSSRKPDYFDLIVQDALKMDARGFSGNARALGNLSLNLSAIPCPVLVVRGQLDYIISADMAQSTVRAFRDARFEEFRGVGHSPQIEAPERFNALLETFLGALP